MADLLLAAGAVTIEAKAGKVPTVTIEAYNGDVMSPPGFGPVVVDTKGLALSASVPLLADHDARTAGMVGSGRPEVRGGRVFVAGTLSAATEAGRQVLQLGRDGVPLQASIGVDVGESEFVRSGETVHVNGRTIKAGRQGFRLVKAGKLKEVSIVALGADETTTVSIAAKATRKGRSVDFEAFVTESGFDPATISDKQRATLRAAFDSQGGTATLVSPEVRAERDRATRIYAAISPYGVSHGLDRDGNRIENLAAHAIANGFTVDETELAAERASRRPGPRAGSFGAGYDAYGFDGRQVDEASILIKCGHEAYAEKQYGERVMTAARKHGARSLAELCANALRRDGREVPHDADEMMRAAFSMVSLPQAIANIANRSLVADNPDTVATWRSFAKIVSSRDFKENKGIRPTMVGELEEVGPTGELVHSTMTEESVFTWKLGTFGRIFSVNRQMLANDDLGVFADVLPAYGRSALRALNDLVWRTILGAGSHYSSGNGNYIEGAGTALALSSLADGLKAIRTQKDAENNDLDLVPRVLAVGPGLEQTARGIINSTEVRSHYPDESGLAVVTDRTTGNTLKGAVALEVEPRIANSAKFPGASATAWWLFCSPSDAPVVVGFKDGRQAPFVEMEPAPFNTLGQQFRVYFDFGCAMGDKRTSLKSKGAA